MEMLIDVFTDAALDCIKMLPFLFLAFLLIEALEHYSSDFTKKLMIKVDKAGPVVGAVVGCVPQCGFSVMAANLYSGGIITIGTLIAVFLATSDEAILIIMGNPEHAGKIGILLLAKVIIAIDIWWIFSLKRKLQFHIMKENSVMTVDVTIIHPEL